MDKDEIIKQFQDTVGHLKYENELLKECIRKLEARQAKYENAHTHPSLKRSSNRKKDQNKGNKRKPGQKNGHKYVTRPLAKPDNQVDGTPYLWGAAALLRGTIDAGDYKQSKEFAVMQRNEPNTYLHLIFKANQLVNAMFGEKL